MTRKPSRPFALLLPLILCAAAAATHARPARADLSCGDCYEVCLLEQCGFVQDPQCVADSSAGCWADCTAQGYC